MKNKGIWREKLENVAKKRAVTAAAAVAAVFLCLFTLAEFTVRKLELAVPGFSVLAGGPGDAWLGGYRVEENALEESTENIILETGETNKDAIAFEGIGEADRDAAVFRKTGQNPKPEETKQNPNPGKTKYHPMPGETEQNPSPGKPELAPGAADDEQTKTGASETEEPEATGSGVTKEEEAEYPYYIKVNREQNCITVYTLDEQNNYTVPYKAMVCSTGLYNATPRGTFHLSVKYLWRELYGGVYGQYASRITGGVLFHSVPYYRKAKNTLCTDKYNKLGQQASMGCIRLTVEDAKWIAENCPSGTTVEIYDAKDPGPLGKPEAVKIDTDNPNKGWDPTDADEENPWRELSEDE